MCICSFSAASPMPWIKKLRTHFNKTLAHHRDLPSALTDAILLTQATSMNHREKQTLLIMVPLKLTVAGSNTLTRSMTHLAPCKINLSKKALRSTSNTLNKIHIARSVEDPMPIPKWNRLT